MAFDYNNSFKRIIAKANLLEERYQKLLQSRDESKQLVEELQQQLNDKEKELERLKTEMEYLRMASTLAPTREQVATATAMIAQMVRDIDRCITDLSD